MSSFENVIIASAAQFASSRILGTSRRQPQFRTTRAAERIWTVSPVTGERVFVRRDVAEMMHAHR